MRNKKLEYGLVILVPLIVSMLFVGYNSTTTANDKVSKPQVEEVESEDDDLPF